ncbi:MAG: hypothetical protein ACI90M_001549 [Candidatus Azotimanducaceae bacterium]|jgi:hypothetical protein
MTMFLSRWRDGVPFAALLLLFATSCATASGVRLGLDRYPAQETDHQIPVFESMAELPSKFVKVGRIVGEGSDLADFKSIVTEMQQRARELGGDALVLTGGGLLLLKGTDFGVDVDRTVHGLAVRWQKSPAGKPSRAGELDGRGAGCPVSWMPSEPDAQ